MNKGHKGKPFKSNPDIPLTDSDVLDIRQRVHQGQPRKTVATLYGISTASVTNIVNGVTYRHLRWFGAN